jgi:hypothetical protein
MASKGFVMWILRAGRTGTRHPRGNRFPPRFSCTRDYTIGGPILVVASAKRRSHLSGSPLRIPWGSNRWHGRHAEPRVPPDRFPGRPPSIRHGRVGFLGAEPRECGEAPPIHVPRVNSGPESRNRTAGQKLDAGLLPRPTPSGRKTVPTATAVGETPPAVRLLQRQECASAHTGH